MGPPIQIFLTTIASAPALRQRQEHLLRILQVQKIPFTSYDLASDEEAKKVWRRNAPANNSSLPGILVGGEFVGSYNEFDEAVEFGELDRFFKLKEPWGEEDEVLLTTVATPQKPIGVPGVATPSQITGQKPSFSASPSKPPKQSASRAKSIDVGNELGFGLEGIKVSEEEMLELVESLGLGGDDADDLVKGLGLTSSKPKSEKTATSNAPASTADQAPTSTIEISSNTPGNSNATTTAPNTTSSKDHVQGSSVTEIASVPKLPLHSTAGGTTKAAVDSTALNSATQTSEAVSKDVLTDSASPKDSRTGAPDSAATAVLSGDDSQLPSATNDEKSVGNPQPQGNAAPDAPLQQDTNTK